jgi:hypothetical protein
MVVMIQVEVFWVVMPYSVVAYQHFRGPCFIHLKHEETGIGKKWHRYRPGPICILLNYGGSMDL